MNKPTHGGRVDLAMLDLDLSREQILDFSASINHLGTPLQVRQALTAALERIGDYPEPEAESLRVELARFHQLPAAHLLPGSGSTELIYLLPQVFRPRRALLVQPCFNEYAQALQQVGCRIDRIALTPENDFYFSVERVFGGLRDDTDLMILANPGNPSGVGIDAEQLLRLAGRLGQRRLLVDEAFVDFCPQRSLLKQVRQVNNLLVLRSMTKFYAIPGLRVGYLAGSGPDISLVQAAKPPWTLSNLAIEAGKACLQATVFRREALTLMPALRSEFRQALEDLEIKVFPGEANYLLCRLPNGKLASLLAKELRRHGLLIRTCADFAPLDQGYFRVAVQGAEANRKLLARISAFLS